ncbi:glycerophosphoryl diester phosphodiesterase [Colletotrichum plurivorum]|uniref:Glycerophosphoryl diester phosphodiesterase n=1 Tax=Colletotrichum plurivorum TaxID=2175906 RepID=A0A8H6JC36_9PEZI|nr:glycerophosphoryl diester phosphodiesterase [Colletotrichum plurivorum]
MTVLYDVSSQSGKTALHRAAEMGLVEVMKGLLAGDLDVDARCRADGFTPLAVACIRGKFEIVQLLLSAGADPNIRDRYGWLPKDHAAYLGYPKIVDAIKQPGSDFLSPRPGERLDAFSILPHPSAGESLIFVNLGTFDLHKNAEKVDLKPYEAKLSPATFLETSFELIIATDPHSQEYRVSLPDSSDESDGPLCFTTKYSEETKIIFKVFNVAELEPVGVAVALISQLKQGLGPKRESLVRDFTIPIVSSKHGHIGSIMFTFVVASPMDPTLSPPSKPQRLNPAARTLLVGHRGEGWDFVMPKDDADVC